VEQAPQKPRRAHSHVKALDSYFAVPTFFAENMMRLGKGIPNSFWKLTFVIWRDVVKPKGKDGDKWIYDYTAKTTQKQLWEDHRINDRVVQQWAAAYAVSGLFTVTVGRRHNVRIPGEPTIWKYHTESSEADWCAFILALSAVVNPHKRTGHKAMRRVGESPAEGVSATEVFQLALACMVDIKREKYHGTAGPALAAVNDARIEELIRRGAGWRKPDGTVEYEYNFAGSNFR
jgi:hypothetical protein